MRDVEAAAGEQPGGRNARALRNGTGDEREDLQTAQEKRSPS